MKAFASQPPVAVRVRGGLRAALLLGGSLLVLPACDEVEPAGEGSCQGAGAFCTCADGAWGSLVCDPSGLGAVCSCLGQGSGDGGGLEGNLDGDVSEVGFGGDASPAAMDDGSVADVSVADGSVGEGGVGEGGSTPDPAVPETAYCDETVDWDPVWAQWEDEVLLLTNEWRASGANCDTEGQFGPTDPLAMQGQLRCAARLHSKDMALNGYFAHMSQDGRQPNQRMQAAGYQGSGWGENIAKGQTSPKEVVDGWVESDGHCANLMSPDFTEIGVGYYQSSSDWTGRLWTQKFGRPGGGGGGGGGGNWCDFYPQLPGCP